VYEQRALRVDLGSGFYRVDRVGDRDVIGPVDYGFREWLRAGALCFGGGPFMGSVLPGSNRLVFTGHSPCWGGFFVSTMGGAGLTFENVGLDYVSLSGRCPSPSALVLRREGHEEVEVELVPVDPQAIWREEVDGESGFYSLQRHLWNRFADSFSTRPRVAAVGPASLTTDFGAIGSSKVDKHGLTNVDCWAGRGGLGSRLAREHNLYGIVFGGSYIDRDLDDRKLADTYFKQRYSMHMLMKDKEATRKYRYDEKLETGGTLGVNFTKLRDRLLSFNYRSVSWEKSDRLRLHEELVAAHYLEQFNRETIAGKEYAHCGERCLAVCKKLWGRYKKDYEPYQAMGPQSGIFDQRAAERVVWTADSLGFDAIQAGGVVAWLLELLDDGLLDPAAVGVEAAPIFEPTGFRAEADSQVNADIACALLARIAAGEGDLDLSNGAREAARRIGAKSGRAREVLDRLVVNCAGERGWMVPNQYWVPGMFSPMPIMGRYYEYYGGDYLPPRMLGRLNAERMSQELFLDNMGLCRFHRGWGEDTLPEIFSDFWEHPVDMRAHHMALGRRINARNAAAFWESGRVVEIIHNYLRGVAEARGDLPELGQWLERFEADAGAAARDYWYEIRKGVDEAFEETFGE